MDKIIKQKVLTLANHISKMERGEHHFELTSNDPEYKILEPVISEEMAEVGLCLGLGSGSAQTADMIAEKCGKSLEETTNLLSELAKTGVCIMLPMEGMELYWTTIWVPGIMEAMVNGKEQVYKYPQIGQAFEEYTRIRFAPHAPNIPVGKGIMRTVPVEKAIDGGSRRASYDEISQYVEANQLFAVTDCSCRTARELMGEGCGHLKEDMCILLGPAAYYYMRTGRARQVSKEDVYDILKRAEDNGLVHQISNVDGDGIGAVNSICNCCGCSCFALRMSQMYRTPDMSRSNFVSKVDTEKCVACGQCVEVCSMNALKLGQKLCTKTPLPEKPERELPYDTEWGADKWNVDYRTNREDVVKTGTAPCKTNCPAHIAIQGYIKLAALGKYTEALELIKQENPFPAVCGRICNRRCESACTRGDLDEPIAIDEIKKFIAEQDLNKELRFIPKMLNQLGKKFPQKIAVIGAGPAGLSCAYYLTIKGYDVTVFEKEQKLGGMLTLGIPSFRLEKDVVEAEIDILREMGVEFKTGVNVGKDVTLDKLRGQGYKAFYLAIGAQAGRKLGLEGEDADGVIAGVDFLRNVNLGRGANLAGKTIVIGGGNVAVDVARAALRSGSSEVSMYCLESREYMPASEDEVKEAEEENIAIKNSWGPKSIVTENGKVTGVKFKKCIRVFDENGRFSPTYDEDNTLIVEADYVLISVGQSIVWGNLLDGSKVETNRNGTVKADSFTYQSAEPDIFIGGDVYTGPKFAIDAIAAGKEGAISIHRFVQPGQSLVFGRDKRQYHELDKENANLTSFDTMQRQKPAQKDICNANKTFRDLRGTFTEEQVRIETERCLGCGATVVDEYMCVGCGVCTTRCKFDAITLVKKYDETGVAFEEMPSVIGPYMQERKAKIAAKKLTVKVAGK